MKVYIKHRNITQNMHGASRNYRYVWDVSVRSCNSSSDCWGHVAYHLLWCLSSLLLLVALHACHFGPECHDFRSEPFIFHEYICVLDPIYELYAPIIVPNRRSQW